MGINYLLMGVVFAFYVEYWNDTKGDKTPFDNWHRVIIVTLWPVLIIVGITTFFKNR